MYILPSYCSYDDPELKRDAELARYEKDPETKRAKKRAKCDADPGSKLFGERKRYLVHAEARRAVKRAKYSAWSDVNTASQVLKNKKSKIIR